MAEIFLFWAVMIFAIALLFLVPMREVTQPPARWYWIVEVLFPGTNPSWSVFGGVAFAAWVCWLLFLAGYSKTQGNLAFITMIATPNLARAYGRPPVDSLAVWKAFRPSWVVAFVVPALLFAVNLLLVFRDKLFRKSV